MFLPSRECVKGHAVVYRDGREYGWWRIGMELGENVNIFEARS
jgi:hypothetical protein